jgi:hypothetical protein
LQRDAQSILTCGFFNRAKRRILQRLDFAGDNPVDLMTAPGISMASISNGHDHRKRGRPSQMYYG